MAESIYLAICRHEIKKGFFTPNCSE